MPVVEEAMYMGILKTILILWSADSQKSTVRKQVDKARRTIYCLMGVGLHGDNGLDPDTSIHYL